MSVSPGEGVPSLWARKILDLTRAGLTHPLVCFSPMLSLSHRQLGEVQRQ